jgi:hypothetical protein
MSCEIKGKNRIKRCDKLNIWVSNSPETSPCLRCRLNDAIKIEKPEREFIEQFSRLLGKRIVRTDNRKTMLAAMSEKPREVIEDALVWAVRGGLSAKEAERIAKEKGLL